MRKGQAYVEGLVEAYFKDHPDEAAERDAHFAQAVSLFSAGVRNGDARAMQLLANLYGNGWGVEKDEVKSMALIRRAAEAADMTPLGDWTASGQAMHELAWQADMGPLVVGNAPGAGRNPEEAAKWYRRWAATVRPGTASADLAEKILEWIDSPEFKAGYFPRPSMPTLSGSVMPGTWTGS